MSVFDPLYKELDEWNFEGEEAMLWWRDDDAVEDTAALRQLLALAERYDVPVALAVIPENMQSGLPELVRAHPLVQVLQHGVRHVSHTPASMKNQELSKHADQTVLVSEMQTGFKLLTTSFDSQFIPVMVPPWNRIDAEVISQLPGCGFLGLSCFLERQVAEPADNVWQVNTHIDIINWKAGKTFVGGDMAVAQLVRHLQAKRAGNADRAEPTGLMTHHLVHDAASWAFLDALFAVLDEHPALTWLSAERAFQTRWRVD